MLLNNEVHFAFFNGYNNVYFKQERFLNADPKKWNHTLREDIPIHNERYGNKLFYVHFKPPAQNYSFSLIFDINNLFIVPGTSSNKDVFVAGMFCLFCFLIFFYVHKLQFFLLIFTFI